MQISVDNPRRGQARGQTGKMSSSSRIARQQLSAAHSARMLIELCRLAEIVRARGYCIGRLAARDVVIDGVRVTRSPCGPVRRMRHFAARQQHARKGHDTCCETLGMPMETVVGLLESWAGAETSAFLGDLVRSTIEQIASGGWSGWAAHEVLKYEIGRHLTIEEPADFFSDQMPSTDSKSAASRRVFTWVRKRAASAPSTTR